MAVEATFNAVEAGGDTGSLTGAKAAADCRRTARSAARYVNLAMFSIAKCCYIINRYISVFRYANLMLESAEYCKNSARIE
mmetsp:Transcript_27610/g.41142  ORF Transcript_27610/g.41142 Transcript_27610/m.41142 type:complete len:81 (+) Transcript_27610:865-1107(+)